MNTKDKPKITFADIWAQRFWIGCGVVALASLVTFFVTKNSLDQERSEREGKINSKKSEIEMVLQTYAKEAGTAKAHPNQSTQKGMDAKLASVIDDSLNAWEMRYRSQQEYLKWPDVIPAGVRQELMLIKQPEIVESEKSGMKKWNLRIGERQTYQESIVKVMPALVEKIGAKWNFETEEILDTKRDTKKADQNKGIDEPGAAPPKPQVVFWNQANQEIWNDKLTVFQNRYGNPEPAPTIMQIFALQQDLWLLGGIFDIIKHVNGEAMANDLAAIKVIDHILIGREVGDVKSIGKVMEPTDPPQVERSGKAVKTEKGATTSFTGGEDARIDVPALAPTKKANVKRKMSAEKSRTPPKSDYVETESLSPFHGRYVDWNFFPVGEKKLIDALTNEGLITDSYLLVARRIPVRIALRMDERKIEEFLAACANSPFVFEIDRFRINRHIPNEGYVPPPTMDAKKSAASKDDRSQWELAGGGGTGGGGAGRVDDASRPSDQGRGGSSEGPAPKAASIEQRTNFDVDVEFYGIVKLYNPVNPDLLKGKRSSASKEGT